jgi:hypothetical protein
MGWAGPWADANRLNRSFAPFPNGGAFIVISNAGLDAGLLLLVFSSCSRRSDVHSFHSLPALRQDCKN